MGSHAKVSSRRSSWSRDQTEVSCVSCIGRQILYHWVIRNPTWTPIISYLSLLQTYYQLLLFLFPGILFFFNNFASQLHCSPWILYSGISETLLICKCQDVSCHSYFCLLYLGNLIIIYGLISEIILALCLKIQRYSKIFFFHLWWY